MTALSESLTEAQRGAMKALTKAIIAGQMGDDDAKARLEAIGLTDAVDTTHYLAALEVLRELGGAPAEPVASRKAPDPERDPASDAQLGLLRKLVAEKGYPVPDYPFTKQQATAASDGLKAGTYKPSDWDVPF